MNIELTDREKEVVALISQGLSNKQIAKQLFISKSTIEKTTYTIYQRTPYKNRVQLAVWAVQNQPTT